jgi:lysophospholipase L1-like esterase
LNASQAYVPYGFVDIEQAPIVLTSPLPRLFAEGRSAFEWVLQFLWRKRSVLALLAPAVLAAEWGVRTAEPRLTRRMYNNDVTGSYPVAVHAPGVRGNIVALEKPLGKVRLLALGDSVTFGTGVPASACWPTQMAGVVSLEIGRPVEPMNTGRPGADLRQIALMLEDQWSQYDPDVAVLLLTGTMVSLSWIRRDSEVVLPRNPYLNGERRSSGSGLLNELNAFQSQLALPGLLSQLGTHLKLMAGLEDHVPDASAPYGVMLAHGIVAGGIEPSLVGSAWAQFESDLRHLAGICARLDIPLVVSYAPPRFMLSGELSDNLKRVPLRRLTVDPVQRTRTRCDAEGIAFVDVLPALKNARQDGSLYALGDYTHFDVKGHLVVAETMAGTAVRVLAD